MLGLLAVSLALALPETDPHEVAVPLALGGPQVGSWVSDAQGLGLQAADPVAKYNYWLSGREPFGSGTVRARVKVGSRLDSTVLFRASAPAGQPELLSGYGFSFEGESVGFYRWNDGVVVSLGPMEKIVGLDDRAEVEVMLYLVGPHFAAVVLDANTLQELGTITARDVTFARGTVGFRAHSAQGVDTRLTTMSVLATELGQKPVTPANDAFGTHRLFTVPSDQVGLLPPAARVVVDTGTAARVYGDLPTVEKARRNGVAVRGVTGYVGRYAYDEDFRAHANDKYVATDAGVDLTASYKDAEMVEGILRAYHARWPDITDLRQIGSTGSGRPIWALRVTDNPTRDEDEPAVLLNAAHHGSELLSVEYALDALQYTLTHQADPRVARWVSDLDLWFVPMVNVDGNRAYWQIADESGRKNMRDNDGDGQYEFWEGVDLNRNYPFAWGSLAEKGSRSWPSSGYFRGPSAGSEPETQAMMALNDRYHFVAAISWHTLSTVIITPYSIDGQPNPTPDVPRGVAEALAATLPVQPNGKKYKVVRKIYAVDGTDQDWHYHAHGTLAYIVEGSHHNPKDATTRAKSIAGVRPFYTGLLDRVATGPRVEGHTVDDRGRPLTAAITVDEIALNNGEVWTSRAHDGRFDRVVLTPGTYHLRATAPGYAPAEQTVTVGAGPARVDFVLSPAPVAD